MEKVDLYKKNQKKSKLFKIFAPICYWLFIIIAVVLMCFAVKNSFGNISEMINLLDGDKYTDVELEENYNYLLDKYGEWTIGSGSAGFTIKFINIGKALFSGIMLVCFVGSIVFFISSVAIGKWLFPLLSKKYSDQNNDLANIETLKLVDKLEKEN